MFIVESLILGVTVVTVSSLAFVRKVLESARVKEPDDSRENVRQFLLKALEENRKLATNSAYSAQRDEAQKRTKELEEELLNRFG